MNRVGQGGYLAQDGIHYRLRPANCSLPAGAMAALVDGVDKWNTEPTGIKIDLLPCNNMDDVVDFFFSVTENDAYTGGCAAVQNGEFLWMDQTSLASWAHEDVDLAGYIVSHEIGHLLALDDAGWGFYSVMNNPPPSAGGCREAAQYQIANGAPTGPTYQDAATMENCAYDAHSGTQIRKEPGANHFDNYQPPSCWERWIIWTINACTTSYCWPVDEYWEYTGWYCGEPSCYN